MGAPDKSPGKVSQASEASVTEQKVEEKPQDFQDNVIKISAQKKTGFYVRAGQNFLQGVKDKDGNDKPAFPSIVFSALGAAIGTCASVVDILERREVAEITSIKTDYVALDGGSRRPQLRVELKAKTAGPKTPERLLDPKMEKKMKKVVKEGGKRGVEIEGAAAMGGLQFLSTKMLEPAEDLDLLIESVKAMNAPSDPAEEERKGGAGAIGKIVMSSGPDSNPLNIVAYVPSSKTKDISAIAWLEEILSLCNVKRADVPYHEESTDVFAAVSIKVNADKNIFPMKFADEVISKGNDILRKKDLIPVIDDDDDDEMVFGDDDMNFD